MIDQVKRMFHIGDRVEIDYYDPDGEPISRQEWRRLLTDGRTVGVADEFTQHGHVQTLWYGYDVATCRCRDCATVGPHIFVVSVFRHGKLSEEIAIPTIELAQRMHRQAVADEGPAWWPCPGGCAGS